MGTDAARLARDLLETIAEDDLYAHTRSGARLTPEGRHETTNRPAAVMMAITSPVMAAGQIKANSADARQCPC